MEKKVTIQNKTGLHARPAGIFVKEATKFKCEVSLINGTKTANGKSIIGLMGLELKYGTEVTIVTKGEDEVEALNKLVKVIQEDILNI